MCGLVGFIGTEECNMDKIAILMLYNETRGKDSTGFFGLTTDGRYSITKDVQIASEFLTRWILYPSKVVIAHTRKATSGGVVTKAKAHPFEYGDIIAAQNGRVNNLYFLKKDRDIASNLLDVDSEIIPYCINKENNYKILSDIYGPCATLIYNKREPNVLYTYRNDERPLHYYIRPEGMYISSMPEGLSCIGASYKEIKEFKPSRLYKITEGKIGTIWKIKKTPKMDFFSDNRIDEEDYYVNERGLTVTKRNGITTYSSALNNQNVYDEALEKQKKEVIGKRANLNTWDDELSETVEIVGEQTGDIKLSKGAYKGKYINDWMGYRLCTAIVWMLVEDDVDVIEWKKRYILNGELVTKIEYTQFREKYPYDWTNDYENTPVVKEEEVFTEDITQDEDQMPLLYFSDNLWQSLGKLYSGKYYGNNDSMNGCFIWKGKRVEKEEYVSKLSDDTNKIIKKAGNMKIEQGNNITLKDEENLVDQFYEVINDLTELIGLYKDLDSQLGKDIKEIVGKALVDIEKNFKDKKIKFINGEPVEYEQQYTQTF